MDMDVMENRRDLIARYNVAVGPPGPQVSALQAVFLAGSMEPSRIAHFVSQCEYMIEARNSMRRRPA